MFYLYPEVYIAGEKQGIGGASKHVSMGVADTVGAATNCAMARLRGTLQAVVLERSLLAEAAPVDAVGALITDCPRYLP